MPPAVAEPAAPLAPSRNGAAWHAALGHVPLERVAFDWPVGRSGERELLEAEAAGLLPELVNGTIVSKPMADEESRIASNLIVRIGMWEIAAAVPKGALAGEAGLIRMRGRNVRAPDVRYTPADLVPPPAGGRRPAVADYPPTFCAEILSRSNTDEEIDLKLAEYFASGCRLAWVIDPQARTARIYGRPGEYRQVTENATLDGGDVLPGFGVRVADLLDV